MGNKVYLLKQKKSVYLDRKLLYPQQNVICCFVTLYLKDKQRKNSGVGRAAI